MNERKPQNKSAKASAENQPKKQKNRASSKRATVDRPKKIDAEATVTLLTGGNPQIAKGYGDEPVQAYIAAIPGWKRGVGERLDSLVMRTLPHVRKCVKWNSPLYGVDGKGWFLGVHCMKKYVKLTFFNGVRLKPNPPGHTERSGDSRWIDIYEDERFDERQIASWIKQAAAHPAWMIT